MADKIKFNIPKKVLKEQLTRFLTTFIEGWRISKIPISRNISSVNGLKI